MKIPHNESQDFLLGVKEILKDNFEKATTANIEELHEFENEDVYVTIKEILKKDRERFIRSMMF